MLVAAVAGGNTANATALYMESFIALLSQDLASREDLSAESRLEIGRRLSETALGKRVVSFKIWRPGEVPIVVKICCYRFAQEGLNNGWRHVLGKRQELRLTLQDDAPVLRVPDRGPGFAHLPVDFAPEDSGLGLAGLTDRVESLGGHLAVFAVSTSARAQAADGFNALTLAAVDKRKMPRGKGGLGCGGAHDAIEQPECR